MKAIVAKDVTIVWESEIKEGVEVEVELCGENRYRLVDDSVDTDVWGECEVRSEFLEFPADNE